MTDEYEKEDDEEYEDAEATSESEEEEAEDADASDESEEEPEDSVASWGYEEKKSRFSKEMIAGFAAIGVLVAIFGIVVYKKMPGADGAAEIAAASLGNPEGTLGDPGSVPSKEDQNDPFGNGDENGLGEQSEPGMGNETSNELIAGGSPNGFDSQQNGTTNFGPDATGGAATSPIPGENANSPLGSGQPFASNSETEDLFPGQPEPGGDAESAVPFGTSTATDEFGRPIASNGVGAADPGASNPFPAENDPSIGGRRDVFGSASTELADAGRNDPFAQPDLSPGSANGVGNSFDNPGLNDDPNNGFVPNNGFAETGSASENLFPQNDPLAENEPTIDGSLGSSFPGDDPSALQPDTLSSGNELRGGTSNDPFGSTSETMTNDPFGSGGSATSSNSPFESTPDRGNSEPGGLFDRDPVATTSDGGRGNTSETPFPNDTTFSSEPAAGSDFDSLGNGSSDSGSAFDSGSNGTSEQPFRSPTDTASNDPFSNPTASSASDLNTGNSFDSGSTGTEDLFPNNDPGNLTGTASSEPFQPPLASATENSFPSSSASPVSSGPFGNESFSTGSPAGPSTFASQPHNSGTYTVRNGDSYWNISKKVYGTAKYFQVLADHNRRTIADPQKMKAGVAIETPPASVLQQKLTTVRRTAPTGLAGRIEPSGRADRAGSASSSNSASSAAESVIVSRRPTGPNESAGILFNQQGYPLFRIGETDTLTSIASDHLGRASRWQQVYNMNRDQLQSPDKLQIGMLLKLPADASRVPLVDRTSSLR